MFRLHTASLLQVMRSTGHAPSNKHDALLWLVAFLTALIGAFRSLLFHSVICSLGGPLSHGSPVVVFLDRGHPRFWNFYSLIPVDVFRVKPYMNCPRSINFTSFQSGLCPVLWACSETAEVSVRASRMSRSCSLILSCIGLPVSPMYTLPQVGRKVAYLEAKRISIIGPLQQDQTSSQTAA